MNTNTNKNTTGELRKINANIDGVTGIGTVSVGDAMFTGSRESVTVGSLVLIIAGDEEYSDTYKTGDIYRVTKAAKGKNDTGGLIQINKKWADEDDEGIEDVLLFTEEYTGLVPANMEAILLGARIDTGSVKDAAADKTPDAEEDPTEDCGYCEHFNECYGDEDEYEEIPAEDEDTQESLLEMAENTLDIYSNPFTYEGEAAVIEYTEAADAVVIAMVIRKSDRKVLCVGYSQCHCDDEYFPVIGKVIAAFRAANCEVPEQLINFSTYK